MADVLPLAVSGEIQVTQTCILMAVVNSTPYYLVTDINGIPYFQPLYQDVTTGLAVFSDSAARVRVSIGNKSGVTSVQIVNLAKDHGGEFRLDPTILKIVAADNPSSNNSLIPIEKLSYATSSLIACGYQYVITGGYGFFTTTNWSANPNQQSINLVAQQPPTTGFYVFPVDGLYDNTGKPTSTTVFTAIYNDVLGKTAQTPLFTSQAAYEVTGGTPYYFCADSSCGPLCYGLCSGQFNNCMFTKNQQFMCAIGVSAKCKVLALLPFLIPIFLLIIGLFILVFASKYSHTHALTGARHHVYSMDLRTQVIAGVMIGLMVILTVIVLALSFVDTNASNWYLRKVCSLSGEFQ